MDVTESAIPGHFWLIVTDNFNPRGHPISNKPANNK